MDRSHGWLAVDAGILATADGGTARRRQPSGVAVARLWAHDARHAWALAAEGALYQTEDGANWSGTTSAAPEIAEIQVVRPPAGWVVATQPASVPFTGRVQLNGSILQSTNGGSHLGTREHAVDTLGDDSTWIVTRRWSGVLMLSRSGVQIARRAVPFAWCVIDATFLDAQHGWIIDPDFITKRRAS